MRKRIILNNIETNYLIDTEGRVYNEKTKKYLNGTIGAHGYVKMTLSVNGKKTGKYLHRLMGMCFLGLDENSSFIINHIDGNKQNNALSNLEIVNSAENLQKAYDTSRRKPNNKTCIPYNDNEITGEEWRPVIGYKGHYEVSSLGRVKSLKYKKPIILREDVRCGYKSVVLSLNGKTKHFQVHRLVYFSFYNQPEKTGFVIDHIDGNKFNNSIANLRYISISDNLNAGLYEQKTHNNCKKVDAFLNDKKIGSYDSIGMASRILGIDGSSISKVCRGKAKSVHGYSFRYSE